MSFESESRTEPIPYVNALLRENEMLRTALATRECDVRRAEDARSLAAMDLERIRVRFDASRRIHASVEMASVLRAIEGVLIDVFGAERAAIYYGDSDTGFDLASSFGFDEEELRRHIQGPRSLDRVLLGEAVNGFSACVPLNIGNRLVGAILIFRPSDPDGPVPPVGHELLDMLAVHASTALYCASLKAAVEVA